MSKSTVPPRTRLQAYAAAAGALGVVTTPAVAEVQPFNPPGGLPITVDSVNSQVDIDIDGDMAVDFRFYFLSSYGGGFAIAGINVGDAANGIESHRNNDNAEFGLNFWLPARRYDPTEWIDISHQYEDGNTNPSGGDNVTLSHNVGARYLPFVDRPGFINLRLQPDSGIGTPLDPRLAFLEIVVSRDHQSLMILSGGYEDSTISAIEIPANSTR